MNSDFPKIEATIKYLAIDVEEEINIQDQFILRKMCSGQKKQQLF
jgi:hypothetical protein